MPNDTTRRGYSLATLFTLVSVYAVIFGLASPLVRALLAGNVPVLQFTAVAAYASFICLSMGVFVGWHHHRQPLGVLWGAMLGTILGPIIGAVILVPMDQMASLFWVTIGGSVLLVILGFGVRINTRC